jgi:hypothetical protein
MQKAATSASRVTYGTLARKLIGDGSTSYTLRAPIHRDDQREPLDALMDARKLLALREARYLDETKGSGSALGWLDGREIQPPAQRTNDLEQKA